MILTADYGTGEMEAAVASIEARGLTGAIEWMRQWGDPNQHAPSALIEQLTNASLTGTGKFIEDWQSLGRAGREDYLVMRWACPSFLCNMALLPLLADRRVLDLGCGVGHLAHQTSLLSTPPDFVAADGILLHCLALRRYFASGTPCVCLDLEDPLPFLDGSFDIVVMNDCFHYVTNKMELLAEVFRVLTDGGLAAFVHVHDPRDLTGERAPGQPLEPWEFVQLIREVKASASISFFGEREFLRQFYQGDEITITNANRNPHPEPGPYLLFAAKAYYPNLSFQRSLGALRPYQLNQLVLNPVYQSNAGQHRFTFCLDWPDLQSFEEFGRESYLPRELTLRYNADVEQLDRLRLMGVLIADPRGKLGNSVTNFR